MTGIPIPALIAAISSWRAQLAEVLNAPDPARAVEHLDKSMEQAALVLADCAPPDDPP